MGWFRFLFLDFLGCVVSVPTSIWIGKFAAEKLAAPNGPVESVAGAVPDDAEHRPIDAVLGGAGGHVGVMMLDLDDR